MSEHISIQGEIEKYLEKINILAKPYADQETGRTFLTIPEKNILLNINSIHQNTGEENSRITEHFSRQKINVIQLWEDQWRRRLDVVKSRLRALTGKSISIHGRETDVVKISNPELMKFLETNHLNVPLKGKYKYGLFKSGQLVSVASFSYPRKISRNERKIKSYELLRFCHLNHHIVIGGLTKLLSYFINEVHPDHIMTYIDREWGQGEGFKKAGFKISGSLPPKSFWIDKSTFQRHYTLPAHSDHFVKVYNCGSLKMEWLCKQS